MITPVYTSNYLFHEQAKIYRMEANETRFPAMVKRLEENETKYGAPYCPCSCLRNEDTICPCRDMRDLQACRCGLYLKKIGGAND